MLIIRQKSMISFISFFNCSANESLKEFLKSIDLEYSTVDVSNEDFDIISYLEEVENIPNILDINVYGGFYGETLPKLSARKVNMHYYFDHHQLLDDDVCIDSNNSDLELSYVNKNSSNPKVKSLNYY